MYITIYDVFYSQYSHQHVSAGIPAIFRVMYILFPSCQLIFADYLTEVFPCFFLCFKANARVYFAKTGQGPHSS